MVLLVQCKKKNVIDKLSKKEVDGLSELCLKTGARALVAFKLGSKLILKPLAEYEEQYLHLRKQHKLYLEEKQKEKHESGRSRKRTASKERKVGELIDDYTRQKKQKGISK